MLSVETLLGGCISKEAGHSMFKELKIADIKWVAATEKKWVISRPWPIREIAERRIVAGI
jgi:hypothetical protein